MFGGEGVEGCCIADLGMDAAKATGIIQESYVSHNHTVTHTYTHLLFQSATTACLEEAYRLCTSAARLAPTVDTDRREAAPLTLGGCFLTNHTSRL